MPQLQVAGQRESTQNEQGRTSHEDGGEHHAPLREPVGGDPAEQHESHQADAVQGGDEREFRGAAAEGDHLPGERDQPQAAAKQRDRQPRPQQPEVALPQGAQSREQRSRHPGATHTHRRATSAVERSLTVLCLKRPEARPRALTG